MADDHDTSNTVHTVHVQRADVTHTVDDYTVQGGVPEIESTTDQELMITRRDDDGPTETLVAMYARGCWLRVWTEES